MGRIWLEQERLVGFIGKLCRYALAFRGGLLYNRLCIGRSVPFFEKRSTPGGDAPVAHKRTGWLLAAICLALTLVTARAEDTATLTISADNAAVAAAGEPVEVTFTCHVAPPAGQEIGVFSIRLLPSEGLALSDEGFWVNETLAYSNFNRNGVFRTFEYTPESRFFAAVGSSPDKRMTAAADVLTVKGTIPGGRYGTFTLDAEFIAAPDGSGVSFAAAVEKAAVTVTGPAGAGTGSGSGSGSDGSRIGAAGDGSAGGITAGGDAATEAVAGDNAVRFDGAADGSAVSGSGSAAEASGGAAEADATQSPDGAGETPTLIATRQQRTTWPIWAAVALLAGAGAVQLAVPGGWGGLLRRRMKKNNDSDTEGEGKQ